MPFNPDEYLAKKTSGFDPDAYLASKTQEVPDLSDEQTKNLSRNLTPKPDPSFYDTLKDGPQIPGVPKWLSQLSSPVAGIEAGKGALKELGTLAAGAGEALDSGANSALDSPPIKGLESLLAKVGPEGTADKLASAKRQTKLMLGLPQPEDGTLSQRIQKDKADLGLNTEGAAQEAGALQAGILPYLTPGIGELGATGNLATKALLNAGLAGGQSTLEGRTPAEAKMAAIIGAIVPPAVSGLGKVAAPFASKFLPEIQQAAERLGITLPASAMTESPVASKIEGSALGKMGGGAATNRLTNATTAVEDIANQITKAGDLSNAGELAAAGREAYETQWRNSTNKLYDSAGPQINKLPIDPKGTKALLDDIVANKETSANFGLTPSDLSTLKSLREGLDGAEVTTPASKILDETGQPVTAAATTKTPPTVGDLRQVLKTLNEKTNFGGPPIVTGNDALKRKIGATLNEDIDAAIAKENPLLGTNLAIAKAQYKDGISKLNSTFGTRLEKAADAGQFDKIVPSILNPKTSVEDIPKIFEVVGPDAKAAVRTSVLAGVLGGATDANGSIVPTKIAAQVKKFGPDRLQAILDPAQYQKLNDLATVGTSLGGPQKALAANSANSATKTIAKVALTAGHIPLLLHPGLLLSVLAGEGAAGVGSIGVKRAIGSPIVQKWLTTGFELPAKAITKGANTATQGASKLADDEEE